MTSIWYSYSEGQIIDVDVHWETMNYNGYVGDIPYFYKKCEMLNGDKVKKRFYLFPDQFRPVG